MCVRVCGCVGACACARRHVRVCVCVGEGFRFAFLCAWVRACGCVRVCVCACGWGGVQGRRHFGAMASAMDLYDTPRTQRDKLFPFPQPKGYPLPTTQGLSFRHEPKGYPLPNLVGLLAGCLFLVISLLAYCWVTGNRLLLVVCVGGWVLRGVVFFG
jgi:hypothetical protein